MRFIRYLVISLLLLLTMIIGLTIWSMYQTTQLLQKRLTETQVLQVYDRNGQPLSVSYRNQWNHYDSLPLYQIPEFLQTAFIASEDRDFFQHHGVNWNSRLRALWQNLRAQHTVSGASTIIEQVVRIIHPRSRNLWSKWLEGFDAYALEMRFSKPAIIEFYLNQVPYAANRRGVLQASRYYFNRDLSSLTHKEMLVLIVLVRAPSNFDLYKNPNNLDSAINRLAHYLLQQKLLTDDQIAVIKSQKFHLQQPQLPVNATQFIDYVRLHAELGHMQPDALHTTLDGELQKKIQAILDERLKNLATRNAHNGAVLVVDHVTGDVLAWVIAGNDEQTQFKTQSYQIDAVTTLRQPGSTFKPFLYALALEKGWTAATLIADAPLSEALGTGLHRFRNYSHGFYGEVTLREALGNSLNIPAVHTINFVGVKPFLELLHQLGFASLSKPAEFYDVGLALGDGAINLLELVRAYSTLANDGIYRPLRYRLDSVTHDTHKQILSSEITSLIANILSDPWARQAEFGMDSILNLPVQTAVKTGTSTDYHDAWAIGFNYRYTVGVWLGNLDQKPMDGVTGAIGPAMILRSVFAELTRHKTTEPLYFNTHLVKKDVCVPEIIWQGKAQTCHIRTEYFIPGHVPDWFIAPPSHTVTKLAKPSEGLRLAIDPRIPISQQAFEFLVEGVNAQDQVNWFMDGKSLATTQGGHYLWPLQAGNHQMSVQVYRQNKLIYRSPVIGFLVKS